MENSGEQSGAGGQRLRKLNVKTITDWVWCPEKGSRVSEEDPGDVLNGGRGSVSKTMNF